MSKYLPSFLLFLLLSMSGVTAASSPAFYQNDSGEIRRSVGRILDSPEFRHFKRLNKEYPFGSRYGQGDGPNGGALGESGSQRGGRAGDGFPGKGTRGDGEEGNFPDGQQRMEKNSTKDSLNSGLGSLGSAVGGVLGFAFHGIAWVFLIAVCALIVFLIVKAILEYDRPTKLAAAGEEFSNVEDEEPEQSPGGLPADVYITRARELAAEGRYREAVAQLLLGAMSFIERAGLIKYRRGLTHRDYLRGVRGNENVHTAMKQMVRTYEPLGFGRREATQTHFEQTLNNYETGFHETSPIVEN